MPQLEKSAIASYFRSDCLRRLKFDLYPDKVSYQAVRDGLDMPPRLVDRMSITLLSKQGTEWEIEKINDLVSTFGLSNMIGRHSLKLGKHVFTNVPLASVIGTALPGTFLVQPEFSVGPAFQNALDVGLYQTDYDLEYAGLRPDLIQVLAPGSAQEEVLADGSISPVSPGDTRIPLRIIDIKLTAEASVPYQVEVSYYSMALAAWLTDNNERGYFVTADPAVWPGSHDASELVKFETERLKTTGSVPTVRERMDALDKDLEFVPFGVFGPRLRRFFQTELAKVLDADWKSLDWHVDNRCIGCDYLGYPWSGSTSTDPRHCWPQADSEDHLSRVAFISRGARGALAESSISTVADLATTTPGDSAFDSHHVLRATRTVIAGRAESLEKDSAFIPRDTGTSAVMPRSANLRMYVTADFDIGSGITIAFGLKSFLITDDPTAPKGFSAKNLGVRVFPVDRRELDAEKRELLHLLDDMERMLKQATTSQSDSTVQVYLWDTVTYDHLVRVIGRHLPAILAAKNLKKLAWLFPPEQVVANPDISSRKSPITIVRDVVRAVVAAPVPHYYSLLNVARRYHSDRTAPPFDQFDVPDLFEDPLSDQIPSERAHEIWTKSGSRPWNVQLDLLQRTVKVRLGALESVTQRLEADLKGTLAYTAPRIDSLGVPTLPARMSFDGRLWFVFAQLNAALTELEVERIRAMPPHEREARYKSAHLTRRLSDADATPHLALLGLGAAPERWVYELAPGSREVSASEGDFGFALVPRDLGDFLDRSLARVAGGPTAALPIPLGKTMYSRMAEVTSVTVKAIDREKGIIVVDVAQRWLPVLRAAESAGLFYLDEDVMLDPVYREFMLKRLRATLDAIGSPPVANALPAVLEALGGKVKPRAGRPSPVADVLWDGLRVHNETSGRVLPAVEQRLRQSGISLNPKQWDSWNEALSRRLHLIWGPPGTGKSKTLRAILLGALHEAAVRGVPQRVLISGPTYEAIDNVLLPVAEELAAGKLALPGITIGRLRSTLKPLAPKVPASMDAPDGSPLYEALKIQIQAGDGLILLGGTGQQVHEFLRSCGGPVAPLFDLVVLDEASQLDVGAATLPLAGLAQGGSVVVAGDPKQLPPIHQAQSPTGLEDYVGSIYTYLEKRHSLPASVLTTNYRSNSTIVGLGRAAGYPAGMLSHSPDLRLQLQSPLPTSAAAPIGWPAHLYWTPEWSELLDPSKPCSVFVYDEGRSSQWNHFEANAVASLTWLLIERLSRQLANERDASGAAIPPNSTPYSADKFWTHGLGVVTPHRAQRALVINSLQGLFGSVASAHAIRESIDTVERFQGQQRDVMIATFALGDPDAISDEAEFLLSLNRFNVMASRARAKLIVLVSRQVVDHLSSDPDVLRGSALLKTFVETFCDSRRPMTLGNVLASGERTVIGEFRWR